MTQSLRDTGKVILKLVFLGLALSFIFSRVFNREHFVALQNYLTVSFIIDNRSIVITQILLLFVNLSFESLKWRYVMLDAHKLSYKKSFLAVVSGISVGMFTPNRAGEFIGRIIFLPDDAKLKGVLGSAILSVLQLSCTVLFGLTGITVISDHLNIADIIPSRKVLFWSGLILLMVTLVLYVIFKATVSRKLTIVYETVMSFRKKSILILFVLSAMRYIVFTLQFVLALIMFEIELPVMILFSGVAVLFLLSTAIPSFLISEVATRGAVAVMIFSALGAVDFNILVSSTFIWILNIALPSLIGTLAITFRK